MSDTQNAMALQTPESIGRRMLRAAGFAFGPPNIPAPDTPGSVTTEMSVVLSWTDRLRLFVSGEIGVSVQVPLAHDVKTDGETVGKFNVIWRR